MKSNLKKNWLFQNLLQNTVNLPFFSFFYPEIKSACENQLDNFTANTLDEFYLSYKNYLVLACTLCFLVHICCWNCANWPIIFNKSYIFYVLYQNPKHLGFILTKKHHVLIDYTPQKYFKNKIVWFYELSFGQTRLLPHQLLCFNYLNIL